MANVKQLKHLEHIEDEMLNYGVKGCMKIVGDLKEIRHMLGCGGTGYLQTKWDGAPSVVCGKDPQNGMFFVMKRDIFPTWEDPRNRNGCFLSFKVGACEQF